jgi:hypothetical protein
MTHEYSAADALDLLLGRIEGRSPDLAAHVRAAIDAGKDVDEVQQLNTGRMRRTYRRLVPLSAEEALSVATQVLRAYFIEVPRFEEAAARELAIHPVVTEKPSLSWDSPVTETLADAGNRKTIHVETRPSTASVIISGPDAYQVREPAGDEVEAQLRNLAELDHLLKF